MARLNQLVPQVFDAQALSAFLRRFAIRGPFGELDVSDTLVPVALFGSIPIQSSAPVFEVGNIDAGITISAVASSVLSTSGALQAGVYDLSWSISVELATNVSWAILVHLVTDVGAVTILDSCTPTTGIAGNGAGHRVEGQMAINIPQDYLVRIDVDAFSPTVGSKVRHRLAWSPRV